MIIIFSAYPDAAVMGCGGTIAKYAYKGEKVVSVIFSYGENTSPILDPVYLILKLISASKKAFKILKSKPIFLGLSDSKLKKRIKEQKIEKKIKNLLKKYKPKIIITHDVADARSAHRSIANFIIRIVKELRLKTQVYTFGIDLPFKLIRREAPKLYVDISKTFRTKQRAIECFEVNKEVNMFQKSVTHVRDIVNGFRIGTRYAEVFYKL